MNLEANQKNAWIAFVVSHAQLQQKISRELEAAGVVPLDVYDVLLTLEEAPERRLRMSELAEKVLFSRSGLTRFVDRLERDGLVERHACANDRRAMHAILTEKGLSERERAWPVYREAIRMHFADKLTTQEAQVLVSLLGRFLECDKLAGWEQCAHSTRAQGQFADPSSGLA